MACSDMMTGKETLVLFGRLRGVSMTDEYLREMLDIFRLAEFADNLVGTYSAGNKRKLSLCVSMLGSPDVLLLDEPYVGVGGPARRRIVDYISALQKITNLSIVLTSHRYA
ncbi:hypothetical protein HPB48_007794 [Haemaphysalis longicornis]|uniref:ABC transporter domain-containing protein n=1 Tax=Haemaphysalis longicornis TaxID=44386 RepID=A0A9J6G6F9_HAELO|nr:hypothetical protein HPB48_007794 [Haemaphysalis longicornis]